MATKYFISAVGLLFISYECYSSTCNSEEDVGKIDCVQVGSGFSHHQNAVCIKSLREFMCPNVQYCWLSCVHVRYGRSEGHVPNDCKCESTDSNSARKSFIDISCFIPDGSNCDWYKDCLEKLHPCEQDKDKYAISYAKHYCEKYGDNYNNFSPVGQRWVDATRKCLQRALVPLLMKETKPSCTDIKSTAFLSHPSCYAKPSSSAPTYCELPLEDVVEITKTIKSAIWSALTDTVKGYFQTRGLCESFPLSLYLTVETGSITDVMIRQTSTIMANSFADLMQWNIHDIQLTTHFYHHTSSETTFGMFVSATPGTNLYEIRDHAIDAVRSKFITGLSSGQDTNSVLQIKDCLDEIDSCDKAMQNYLKADACSAVGGICLDVSKACNLRRFTDLCKGGNEICCAEDESFRDCVAYGGECQISSSCVSGSKLQARCTFGTCCMPRFVGPLKITAEKIAQEAESHDGSTDWKQPGYGMFKHWKYLNKPKCNVFVFDVLHGISAAVPNRKHGSYAPIGANEWGNPSSSYINRLGCYVLVTSYQRGDIISFPRSQGSGHVGIITSATEYISAQYDKIEIKTINLNLTRVVWRYNYSNPDC